MKEEKERIIRVWILTAVFEIIAIMVACILMFMRLR
jgi:hypothetical protein